MFPHIAWTAVLLLCGPVLGLRGFLVDFGRHQMIARRFFYDVFKSSIAGAFKSIGVPLILALLFARRSVRTFGTPKSLIKRAGVFLVGSPTATF